jgi:putative selenate reductase
MAELISAPFADLVNRLYLEPKAQGSLFALPRRRWYVPQADRKHDLTVRFHGKLAGNAAGPAAGPHTQMAQNILLSYVAGARILELKTVQVNDRLTIGRPCIDMTNVGYNIEWSQELLVEDSLREYVAGAMLIEMFRRDPQFTDNALSGPVGEAILDLSVGYDLAGIRSDKVQKFLDGMRDASHVVEKLRAEIPAEYSLARNLQYPSQLSSTLTLSTFHGCPADEIERICEFLIHERDLDVIVKMNPPMLGKERLEHLLHEELGYTELTVNPTAYISGLQFDEAVQLVDRLTRLAHSRGRQFGCKFSNTLEVLNHRTFFTPDNKIQYLSGQPLYVITLTLTDIFRQAVGPQVPISFSAGIDQANFPHAIACGFVPVTVSSDLLRIGGYGRISTYLQSLEKAMTTVGAKIIDDYMLKVFGQADAAEKKAVADSKKLLPADHSPVSSSTLAWVGLLNTTIAAAKARADNRYRADKNRKVPTRIDSQLETFDCITCDKCLPVCPNAANFTYPTPIVAFDYHDLLIDPSGAVGVDGAKKFEITEKMQIACYADFCNECGNCDTFCPEYGGPYIKKPTFYGSQHSWQQAAPRDGFFIERTEKIARIRGRIKNAEYALIWLRQPEKYEFTDGTARATLNAPDHSLITIEFAQSLTHPHRLDLGIYHTLRHLLHGILDRRYINQINAAADTVASA